MKEGMKMPGFTAEVSLYKPRRHYSLAVSRGVDGQVVIPQRHIPDTGSCWLERCGDGWCFVCMSKDYTAL